MKRLELIAITIVAILHFVGIIGLQSSYASYFERLTPLNLLIAFLLVYYFHEGSRLRQCYFFILAFLVGLGVEIIGVQTGFPFGSYYYTDLLGPAVFGVPLMIGINWFILSYGLIALINKLLPQGQLLLKSIIGAFLMTLIDVFIEPFAIHHGLWVWADTEVPFANYVAWFLISLTLFIFGFKVLPKEKNKVALSVYLIFLVFFMINLLYF